MKNIFLEGDMGAGKSTILFRELEKKTEIKKGGFAVKRTYNEDKVVSMEMVDLMSGAMDTLVTFEDCGTRKVNTLCFKTVGVPAITAALNFADVVVMDELGRFELKEQTFLDTVFFALDSKKPIVGVLKNENNFFLDRIRERPDVHRIFVKEETRESCALSFKNFLDRLL